MGAYSEGKENLTNSSEATIQKKADSLNIKGQPRIYSKKFAIEFTEIFLTVRDMQEALVEGISKMAESSKGVKEEKELKWIKNELAIESEGIKFEIRKYKKDTAESMEEIEAEALLNGYIAQIEILAGNLTDYYNALDSEERKKYITDIKSNLDELEYTSAEIQVVADQVVKDY